MFDLTIPLACNPSTLDAFYRAVREIKAVRGQVPTAFDMKVAEVMYQTLIKALEDTTDSRAVYRVMSAPTGSGKTTFAIAAMKAVVETIPDGSCLFLCETMEQLEDMYREVITIIDPSKVGVFSTVHNIRTPIDIAERDHGITPSFQMDMSELDQKQVLLVTHRFYRDRNGYKAMVYKGWPRTITFIDERPNEVTVFDVTTADVKLVRDALADEYGVQFPGVIAATSLHDYLERVWSSGSMDNFEPLELPSEVLWFTSQACADTVAAGELRVFTHEVFKSVVGLARSMAAGYAFVARFVQGQHGGRFIGYDLDMPIRPGTIVLDATADLDGVSQIADWRIHTPVPKVSFENLEVIHIGIPKDIIGSGENWSSVTGNRRRAIPYGKWIMEEVERNTRPGDKVLVVTHKAIVENNYVPADHRFFEQAYDLKGRKVCFIHWGAGVGSNRWQDANVVMLFGEFFIPRRVIVGQALGYSQKAATEQTLRPYQRPNAEPEDYAAMRDGHLDRWLKQLAMRGQARRLDQFGKCGHQRLYITADYDRISQNIDILFPGAKLTRDHLSLNMGLEKGGATALMALLRSFDGDRLDAIAIKQRIGVDMVKHGVRYLANPQVQAVMRQHEWQWIRGKRGRGSVISHFTKVETAESYGFTAEAA